MFHFFAQRFSRSFSFYLPFYYTTEAACLAILFLFIHSFATSTDHHADVLNKGTDTEDRAEYFDNLEALRKSIASKQSEDDYVPEEEGTVVPRIRTAKKRGDGYTVYKKMSSKYKSEHAGEIDDTDW